MSANTGCRNRRVLAVAAALVLSAGVLAGCTGSTGSSKRASASGTAPSSGSPSAPPGGIAPDTRFTALSASFLTTPAVVTGTDGKTHLAYELLLTNASALPVMVNRIDVQDAANHRALLSLNKARLAADATPLSGRPGDEDSEDPASSAAALRIAPSSTSIVWLDVTVGSAAQAPARLEHRVVGALATPGGEVPFDNLIGTIATVTRPPVVLSPPVQPGTWYMSEGCCSDDTHHRRGLAPINGQLLVPQRYAIDFFKLDAQHRTWVGDPRRPSSYLSYRQPVIAAADGTVVEATDGIPNSTALPNPPKPPPIQQTVGNHVIEQITPGVYVLYAHFDPGSVKVHAGQHVKRGELLGLIGTSGNSTTPHLHFQILDTPTFFPTDSKPWVFDRFTLIGSITKRLWDDNLGLQPTGVLPFAPASAPGERHDQLPLDRTVVQFTN